LRRDGGRWFIVLLNLPVTFARLLQSFTEKVKVEIEKMNEANRFSYH
jgi:hypothetical protein